MLKNMPFAVTVVSIESGAVLNQSLASMAMFGCISSFTRDTGYALGQERSRLSYSTNFISALFEGSPDEYLRLKSSQGFFKVRLRIVNGHLRSRLGIPEGDECWHDVTVSSTCDPMTLAGVFIVSQIDVSDILIGDFLSSPTA